MSGNLKHDVAFIHLDDAVPQSAAVWQSEMENSFPELRVVPLGGENFTASCRFAGTEEFQLSDIKASPHIVERHPGVVTGKGMDYFKVSLQLAGTGEMVQGDRHFTISPGMMTVYDTSQPYDLRFEEDSRFLIAMFPKYALDIPPGLASELTAQPFDCTIGVGAIMSDYLLGLSDNLAHVAGPKGERLARTSLQLMTTLLTSEEQKATAQANPYRQALLVEICFFIRQNLSNPDLVPDYIAAAHFISTRQLYNIFKTTGVNVAQWIKQSRLAECKRELSDPLLADVSVSTIASRWTFGDPAYFSRIFKEAYGVSPSQWRETVFMNQKLVA